MHGKALVAGCGLALGAGQCVFLVALGVQEDGEVLADGLKALGQHLFRRGAHDYPVAVAGGQPQQFVTDGPADAVDLELGGTGIGGGHDVSCGEGGAGVSGGLFHISMTFAVLVDFYSLLGDCLASSMSLTIQKHLPNIPTVRYVYIGDEDEQV